VEVIHDGLLRTPTPPERAEARRALGLDPERFTVALLGRVSAWKGQDVLARALADPALAGIGAVGLVAGEPYPGNDGAQRSLESLRDQLGIAHRLRLLGYRDDPDTVLGTADAVAVPSTLPDPFPNSALEAAAAGVPVVASAHGGVVEMLHDGETGRLVAPGDPRALAGALRELADDPSARARLGAAAAADVRERFSRERMLTAIQRMYDRLG
jgi:glycosyltransferase involved in cell wall biosynthesis